MTTGLGTTYGLLSTGFVAPSLDTVRAEREADVRAAFGQSVPLGDNTFWGQDVATQSDREVAVWDLIQAVVASQDPDQATAAALVAVCALTGTQQQPAASSTAIATLCGTPGTVVSAGSQVKTASTSQLFATQASATITLLASWAGTTAYTVGQRVTNGGKCYQCTVAGTSSGSGGPTAAPVNTPPSGIVTTTDGGVTWLWIGTGTGAIDVAVASLVQDAITAVAGDLAAIATAVGGWVTAFNVLDAKLGNPIQTDEDLRLAREAELAASGSDTDNAIRAALLETTGVTSATVFANNTDFVDGNGLAPHSVLALVTGGADADVAATLFANVGDGIGTNVSTVIGGVTITVVTLTDSEGISQQVGFVRPTLVNIYARVTLSYDATKYVGSGGAGDVAVETAIATWGNALGAGFNAVASAANAQAFSVAGVLDSTTLVYTDAISAPVAWAGTTSYVATPGARSVVTNDGGRAYICTTGGTSAGSGGPTGVGSAIADGSVVWAFLGNTISIDHFHEAVWDTSRVAVSSSAGTP